MDARLPPVRSPVLKLTIAACSALIAGAATMACAVAGPVAETQGATLRLIAGPVVATTAHLGLEIAMKPGWHTYWRYPGDSGVPPEITLAAPGAAKGLAVTYPSPKRFGTAGDETIGYEGDVVLPIAVTLADPAHPATISIAARLGICHDICLPVDETLTLTIDAAHPPAPGDAAAITAAEASVPKAVAKGAPLSVMGLKVDTTAKPPVAEIALDAAAGAVDDVFVEGPEGWALPLPTRIGGDAATSRWRFALDGLPSGAQWHGAALTVTIIGDRHSATQAIALP